MERTLIAGFYKAHGEVIRFLEERGEVSFSSQISDTFRRSLVLAIASFFETVITDLIRDVVRNEADSSEIVCALVEQKAIKRQYHTYFSWAGKNANSFFALFGDSFKDTAAKKVRENPELDEGIKAFLELGEMRNFLVHQNFVTYSVEKTADELLASFERAAIFVEFLERELSPPRAPELLGL